ncbi:hypothetical protein LC55x_1212 [Lysobacter capsici]|nr:hypothetical protein LC55x_1212 [Lysobacter capsici]
MPGRDEGRGKEERRRSKARRVPAHGPTLGNRGAPINRAALFASFWTKDDARKPWGYRRC